jgi:hypothetical protein
MQGVGVACLRRIAAEGLRVAHVPRPGDTGQRGRGPSLALRESSCWLARSPLSAAIGADALLRALLAVIQGGTVTDRPSLLVSSDMEFARRLWSRGWCEFSVGVF